MREDIDKVEDRLTRIFRMILDQPDATMHGLSVELRRAGLSIADLNVVVAGGGSPLETLMRENQELQNELRLVRGVAGLSWIDFVGVCDKFVDTRDPGWMQKVAPHLGCTAQDFRAFQRNNRVPQSLLAHLESMPDLRAPIDSRDSALNEILDRIRDLASLADQLRCTPR